MKRRAVALFLVAAMAVVSGGCGKTESSIGSSVEKNRSSVAQETSTTEKTGLTVREMKDVEDVDSYAEAVKYEDLYDLLGPIPKIDGTLSIGYTIKSLENDYWNALKSGVEAGVEEVNEQGQKVTLDVRAAEGESDEQGQASVMNDMVNRKYDVLLASPISDGNLVQTTEKAHDAGIPVICAIGGFVQTMDTYIGTQNAQGGALAAEWIADKLGAEGGDVAVITGLTQEQSARGRTQGFTDYMEKNAPQCKVVDTQSGEWNREKARSVMQTLLKKYPDLKAVFCNNDTMALGAVEAVKAADADVLVVGNDAVDEALDSIRNGDLDATVNVFADYTGRMALEVALRTYGGQEIPKVIYTSQSVIDKDNVDKDSAEIINWQGFRFSE